MPTKVQIFLEKSSPSLVYVLNFVFEQFYGCGYSLISNKDGIDSDSIILNYSNENIQGSIQIVPNAYLFETELSRFPDIKLEEWRGVPVFFSTDGDLPFDLFSAIFFLLSRAEEYTNASRDEHGRFLAEYSTFPNSFIGRPIIDEWLYAFKNEFLQNTGLTFVPRSFQWVNTYDIDVAYAFKYRPASRKIAATVKNLLRGDFHSFKKRFKVLINGESDPFDTYDFQAEISKDYPNRTLYFFLLADKSRYDRNLSAESTGMRSLIGAVAKFAEVGIHPSYASVDAPKQLSIEMKRLSSILENKVVKSRQHFLRFRLPETYQNLIANGILEDYSMGYADCPGFRTGTCSPHYFFDLKKNETTTLKIFPLTVMDGTLRDYQFLSSNIASQTVKTLIDRVKTVDGTFVSLWHNDTLQDKPANFWRQLYLEMASYTSNN